MDADNGRSCGFRPERLLFRQRGVPERGGGYRGSGGGKRFQGGFRGEHGGGGYRGPGADGRRRDRGRNTGFDLDLAQEAAKRLGLEYKAQPIAWDSKDMELESGNIDCIWNGFTITGRENDYEWTEAYMDNAQVFVVYADSGIETLADLAGKVVECQADSSALAALNEDQELTATFAQLLTTADYNSALMDLEQGAVDAVAMDVVVASYQIQQRDADFVILDETLSSEAYAVGFKKGNTELRDAVQGALEEMAADGTMKEISEKWFGEDLTVIGK